MNWFTITICGDCGQQVRCFEKEEYCECENND